MNYNFLTLLVSLCHCMRTENHILHLREGHHLFAVVRMSADILLTGVESIHSVDIQFAAEVVDSLGNSDFDHNQLQEVADNFDNLELVVGNSDTLELDSSDR